MGATVGRPSRKLMHTRLCVRRRPKNSVAGKTIRPLALFKSRQNNDSSNQLDTRWWPQVCDGSIISGLRQRPALASLRRPSGPIGAGTGMRACDDQSSLEEEEEEANEGNWKWARGRSLGANEAR